MSQNQVVHIVHLKAWYCLPPLTISPLRDVLCIHSWVCISSSNLGYWGSDEWLHFLSCRNKSLTILNILSIICMPLYRVPSKLIACYIGFNFMTTKDYETYINIRYYCLLCQSTTKKNDDLPHLITYKTSYD